jgi:hypothetical protein
MTKSTQLRYIKSKDADKILEYVAKMLPYKVEIKGNPTFVKGKWYLFVTFFVTLQLHAVAFVIPEINTKFDSVDANIATNVTNIAANTALTAGTTSPSSDGNNASRVARATWDFAVDGGSGAIDLGVDIPANALINLAYFYTVTQVTDSGSGTGALHCEDANNLFSAADVTGNGDGTVVLGIPQNTSATMVKAIAADCDLTWTIATAAATAGKLIFFVHYTVVE